MENIEEIIESNPRYFAAISGSAITGYYVDKIHDIDSITTPYVEITEELWLALIDDSAGKQFVNSSDIVDGKTYTIDDLSLFQTITPIIIDFPKTEEELTIESLQTGLQETQTDLDELHINVGKKPDMALLTTAEYEILETNGELKEYTLYMLTDDTFEEDLLVTVNNMNNIDYDSYLAFDTTEIV